MSTKKKNPCVVQFCPLLKSGGEWLVTFVLSWLWWWDCVCSTSPVQFPRPFPFRLLPFLLPPSPHLVSSPSLASVSPSPQAPAFRLILCNFSWIWASPRSLFFADLTSDSDCGTSPIGTCAQLLVWLAWVRWNAPFPRPWSCAAVGGGGEAMCGDCVWLGC